MELTCVICQDTIGQSAAFFCRGCKSSAYHPTCVIAYMVGGCVMDLAPETGRRYGSCAIKSNIKCPVGCETGFDVDFAGMEP